MSKEEEVHADALVVVGFVAGKETGVDDDDNVGLSSSRR